MPDTTTVPQGTGGAGTAGLAATLSIYYKKETLKYVKKALRLEQFGMPDNVPMRQGTQIIWTRYDRLSGSTTALTEGKTPTSTAMSSTNITGTLVQYGAYTLKSDFILDTSWTSQVADASENLAYAAAETIDTLIRDELTANAAVTGTTGTMVVAGAPTDATPDLSSVGNSSVIQAVDFLACKTKLHNRAVPPFFSNGDYGAVLAAPCTYDLQSDTSAGGWIDINKYNNQTVILEGEAGKVHGVRIVDTHNYYSTSTSTSSSGTCYYNWVFGRDAFGIVKLGQSNTRIIIKNASNSGTDDPLEQRNSIGYKFAWDTKYLKTALTTDVHRLVWLAAGSAARNLT